jgi:hypothetical protein
MESDCRGSYGEIAQATTSIGEMAFLVNIALMPICGQLGPNAPWTKTGFTNRLERRNWRNQGFDMRHAEATAGAAARQCVFEFCQHERQEAFSRLRHGASWITSFCGMRSWADKNQFFTSTEAVKHGLGHSANGSIEYVETTDWSGANNC